MLLFAIFLLASGSGGLATLTAVRLEGAGVDTTVIGLVATAYFLGLTIGSTIAFRLIAKVGHIRAFAAFVSVLSALALVYAIHVFAATWALARLLEGFCMAGVYICLESWLAARSGTASRGSVLGAYMVALYAGQALSQFLLTTGGAQSHWPFIGASMLLSLSVIPIALTRREQPVLAAVVPFGLKRLYAISPLGVAGGMASGLILGGFYGIAPIYARLIGLDVAATASFMSAAIVGGMLLQIPVGRLSDAFDRRKVLLLVYATVAAVSIALALSEARGLALFIAMALFGGTAFALYPLCVAHANDHVDNADRIATSAGMVLAYSLGAIAGPLLGSLAVSAAGPSGLFLYTAACAAAIFVFALWRLLDRPPVPDEEQRAFIAMPRTSPAVAPLDPMSGAGERERADAAAPPDPADPA
ncbi:MFS transporter [Sphingomicrobium astaxanthinifaciens]|uniref:MFS transporter n=1 Tax=Sphingomicrobium astaxanthinifaciens TaxID=1227949 RepID=UPI002ACD52E9|nr:MFS transporter [Sphingomicrobium astaxanthinifaciens]